MASTTKPEPHRVPGIESSARFCKSFCASRADARIAEERLWETRARPTRRAGATVNAAPTREAAMLRAVWRVRVRSVEKRARRAVGQGGARPDPTVSLDCCYARVRTRSLSATCHVLPPMSKRLVGRIFISSDIVNRTPLIGAAGKREPLRAFFFISKPKKHSTGQRNSLFATGTALLQESRHDDVPVSTPRRASRQV